jgi:hypothetical protein
MEQVSQPQFQSAEEEVRWLRAQLAERATTARAEGASPAREDLAARIVKEHATKAPEEVYKKGALVPEHFRQEIVLALAPEAHDEKMAEIVDLVERKGVAHALDIVGRLNDPHLADDLHRFLVAYVAAGYRAPGAGDGEAMGTLLRRALYELHAPEESGKETSREDGLKELVGRMEQLYSGIGSGAGGHLTVELANPAGAEDFSIFLSVPERAAALLEKQVATVFPGATVIRQPDDYNPFSEGGVALASEASLQRPAAFPLRLASGFDSDPMVLAVSALSKLDRDMEGAAVQLVLCPPSRYLSDQFGKGLRGLEKGDKSPAELDARDQSGYKTSRAVSSFAGDLSGFFGGKKKDKEPKSGDQAAIEAVRRKLESPIASANLRIVACAAHEGRAQAILRDLESSFGQYDDPLGNALEFASPKAAALEKLLRRFSFREYSAAAEVPLSLREAATMFHLPKLAARELPGLRRAKAGTAPAPLGLPEEGIVIGTNVHQGRDTIIRLAPEDRLRHLYVIGQTGAGKSSFLKQLILQDIRNGEGVCFMDPHGSDVADILGSIPPERFEDVIYFDPGNTERPIGLNMLEYDQRFPEQKTFVVNELFGIFKKLYGGTPESMGPAFEQYFRNSALLVMEHPESGSTLVDLSRVLSDKKFREFKLSVCKNPLVTQFWRNAEKTTGEQGLANYVQYVSNKFDVFLSNEIMRPVVAQERSTINFREVMDQKKILLVNLAKGRLGDINSHLIGLIVVGKILMAALSRVDSFGKDMPPFYCYMDEFHTVTTDSISTILSEARKYKLALSVGHQFIAQLDEKIRDSVFGNVGNFVTFRVGPEDAEFLEKLYAPVFAAKDLGEIENLNAYARILAKGMPLRPFSIKTGFPPKGNPELAQKLAELSRLTYGRPRDAVEAEIMAKYTQTFEAPAPAAPAPLSSRKE